MKWFALLGLLMFLGVAVAPSISAIDFRIKTQSKLDGNTFYVGGSGPNNFTTIQEAVDYVPSNSTIKIYYKTYYEHILINKTLSLIGIPESNNQPIIDGSGSGRCFNIDADHCIFDGLHVKNFGDNSETHSGFYINKATRYTIIRNCEVTGNGFSAIFLEANADYTEISYCTLISGSIIGINSFWNSNIDHVNIHNNTIVDFLYAIDCTLSDSTINNNIIDGEILEAISLNTGSNTTIYNNTIFGSEAEGIYLFNVLHFKVYSNNIYNNDVGLGLSQSKKCIIENNFIHNNKHGIRARSCSGVQFKNNTVTDNKNHGVTIQHGGGNNTIEYNNINSNIKSGIYIYNTSNFVIKHNHLENNSNGVNIKSIPLYGVEMDKGMVQKNTICNNTINGIRIGGWEISNTIFDENIIDNNANDGIKSDGSSKKCIFSNNIIKNNGHIGIEFTIGNDQSTVEYNRISNNQEFGLYLTGNRNKIKNNDFINNSQTAFFKKSFLNFWNENYWNGSTDSPYIINGKIGRKARIPWIQFDWHPAQEPYNI
jgi:parallel beta-helix repeat protein